MVELHFIGDKIKEIYCQAKVQVQVQSLKSKSKVKSKVLSIKGLGLCLHYYHWHTHPHPPTILQLIFAKRKNEIQKIKKEKVKSPSLDKVDSSLVLHGFNKTEQ